MLYTITVLLHDETYIMTSDESPFLPAVGDEMRFPRADLDGTFRITRRIFTLHEGRQKTVPVTVYCAYRSRKG